MTEISGADVLTLRFGRLRIALWASLVVGALVFVFEFAELAGLFALNPAPEAEFTAMEGLYVLVSLATLVVLVLTSILWCMWLHRAAKNLVDANVADFEYTPAWAVGWHFVPFAHLFKPFEVMRKIWNARSGGGAALDLSAPIVNHWWTAWIISLIAGNISGRIALQAENPETLYLGTAMSAVSSVATFVAIPLALKMLEAITKGQVERFG